MSSDAAVGQVLEGELSCPLTLLWGCPTGVSSDIAGGTGELGLHQ